jgi:ribosomal protein S18 acetylase RimI-like enzyme
MNVEIKFGTKHLNWPEVCQVFERAPLGSREPDRLRRASEQSSVVCSAYDGQKLVGFGRAISDGEYYSAVYDVVVLPEYQGRGVGRAVMEAVIERLPSGSVLILSVPGKEDFYKKLGFEVLKTGMGLFPNPDLARDYGYIV